MLFRSEDPERHFLNTCMTRCPAVNLRSVLLLRLDGISWQEIANMFGISTHSTVASFHDRELRNLVDYFRNNLCDETIE